MKKVNAIKLITGELLYGIINGNIHQNVIEIENPLIYQVIRTNHGTISKLDRYIPFSNNNIVNIDNKNVVAISDTTKEMNQYYEIYLQYIQTISDKMDISDINKGINSFVEYLKENKLNEDSNDPLDILVTKGNNNYH